MQGGSNIITSIHHIRIAHYHLKDFIRSNQGSKGAKLFEGYCSRLEWIYKDLLTHPFLSDLVRAGVKREWNSDCYATDAIKEKVALLEPTQREVLENLIDALLKGEQIQIETI